MDKNESIDVLVYGLMVIGLGRGAHRIDPGFTGATLPILVAIGILIAITGVQGLCGFRRRLWPAGTITMAAGLLLVQAARAWVAVNSGDDAMKPVAVILSLLVFFAIKQLVTLMMPHRSLSPESGRSIANDTDVNQESRKETVPKDGIGQ